MGWWSRSRPNSRTGGVVVAGDLYFRSSTSALVEFIPVRVWGEEGFYVYFQYIVKKTSGWSVSYSGVSCTERGNITCPYKGVRVLVSVGVNGSYENHEVALNCGTVLREAFKHEQLAKIVLYSPGFWSFFDYVETGVFDVAGDAFSTFKVPRPRDLALIIGTISTAQAINSRLPLRQLYPILQKIRCPSPFTKLRYKTTVSKGAPLLDYSWR